MTRQEGLIHSLSQITATLLEPEDNFGTITEATNLFFHLLMDITKLDGESNEHRDPVMLPTGKGIGPFWAAMCVKELLRTKKFVRGFYLGILAAQEKFPDTPIHVLYAGTGPFGTLALPMTTVFSPEQLRFTMLEINPESVRMLRHVVDAFQIGAYIQDIKTVDAAQYRVDPEHPVHMVLTETMQNGLQKEPQVAITLNLVPQMHPEGILIPENIEVWAGLRNPQKAMANAMSVGSKETSDHILLERVFTLDRHHPECFPNNGIFPSFEINVSQEQTAEYPQLHLFTEIQVFGPEKLRKGQCGLTLPLKLADINGKSGMVTLQYVANDAPGFRFHFQEYEAYAGDPLR